MVLMVNSEARGTLIYEKNLKSKFSCQTPFKALHPTLIKKKIKFSSYLKKFRMEQLQSHIMTYRLLMYGEIFAHFLIY
jgi:hypothetical protein